METFWGWGVVGTSKIIHHCPGCQMVSIIMVRSVIIILIIYSIIIIVVALDGINDRLSWTIASGNCCDRQRSGTTNTTLWRSGPDGDWCGRCC